MNKIIIPILLPILIFAGIAAYMAFMDDESDSSEVENVEDTAEEIELTLEEEMSDSLPSLDQGEVVLDNDAKEAMMEDAIVYQFRGDLLPVDGSNSSGEAMFGFDGETYNLAATFENLPDPDTGFFYEGWVVRSEPFNFISTGELEQIDGIYTNLYSSSTDYSDHTMYVLTIEPDDGDPAPAAHVVEGPMDQAI